MSFDNKWIKCLIGFLKFREPNYGYEAGSALKLGSILVKPWESVSFRTISFGWLTLVVWFISSTLWFIFRLASPCFLYEYPYESPNPKRSWRLLVCKPSIIRARNCTSSPILRISNSLSFALDWILFLYSTTNTLFGVRLKQINEGYYINYLFHQ
jgi:hypothetical protein